MKIILFSNFYFRTIITYARKVYIHAISHIIGITAIPTSCIRLFQILTHHVSNRTIHSQFKNVYWKFIFNFINYIEKHNLFKIQISNTTITWIYFRNLKKKKKKISIYFQIIFFELVSPNTPKRHYFREKRIISSKYFYHCQHF